jgi:hypothetical protein
MTPDIKKALAMATLKMSLIDTKCQKKRRSVAVYKGSLILTVHIVNRNHSGLHSEESRAEKDYLRVL